MWREILSKAWGEAGAKARRKENEVERWKTEHNKKKKKKREVRVTRKGGQGRGMIVSGTKMSSRW